MGLKKSNIVGIWDQSYENLGDIEVRTFYLLNMQLMHDIWVLRRAQTLIIHLFLGLL